MDEYLKEVARDVCNRFGCEPSDVAASMSRVCEELADEDTPTEQ